MRSGGDRLALCRDRWSATSRIVLLAFFAATPAAAQGALTSPAPVTPQPIPPAHPPDAKPSPTTPPSSDRFVFVPSGIDRTIGWISQLYPNCASMGSTEYRVQVKPEHGTLTFQQGDSFSSYAMGTPLQRCNEQKSPGLFTRYTSAESYVGEDHAEVLYLLPSATALVVRYTIVVR